MKWIVYLIVCSLFFSGCRKEDQDGPGCSGIRSSMVANNIDGMRQAMEELFHTLPSLDYNKANMDLLIDKISDCDIDTGFYCFDCVQTLPSQTEIQLILQHNGSTIKKTLDISYNSSNNTLRFVNMHD